MKFFLTAITGLTIFCSLTNAAKPPHLIVILVDDMGYGDPGCCNKKSKIATPNIDQLAAQGMRFTDAHAPGPLCHMSRYGLMTGRCPFRADVTKWPTHALIEPGQVTLPSLLASAGYATAMVGKWHLGFEEKGFEEKGFEEKGYDQPLMGGPIDHGFGSFFGIRASTDISPYFYIRGNRAVAPPINHIDDHNSKEWSPNQGEFWRGGGIAADLQLADVLPRFTAEAISVIKQRDLTKPLMLYLAYPAPHTPWLPSPAFSGKSGAGMYGDFLMMVDDQIGQVIAALASAKMLDESLIIFTSDNGPVWYPQDVQRYGHDAVAGLRGMKGDAWEAGHRMPFIARWPGVVMPGTVSAQTICFTDLLATMSAVVGKNLPADAAPDSVSFLPSLKNEAVTARVPLVMRSSSGLMSIRSGNWKLIEGQGSGGFSRPEKSNDTSPQPVGQLYDLSADLAETKNLFAAHPEIVKRLRAEMQKIISDGRSR